MRIGVVFATVMGVALAGYLIVHAGFGPVFAAIAQVGLGGFAVLCLYGAALFALLGCAWFALIPAREKPDLATFVWGRAVRDCAGEILPFSQVGGLVIGARAVMLRHVRGPVALASTIVDMTVEMIAQIAFVLAGLAILIGRSPRSPEGRALVDSLAFGLVAAVACAALFFLLQRRSLERLGRWAERLLPQAAAQAGALHRSLVEIHSSPLRLAASLGIHLVSWIATALWAWIAIRLIGKHLAFSSVLAIEAILYAVRSAAVFVPGAIGVQEAAYAILGPLFGLSAPLALAISLLKRGRDVALGVPVLLTWQAAEGGHALSTSRETARLAMDE
jgi:putative membrane protein